MSTQAAAKADAGRGQTMIDLFVDRVAQSGEHEALRHKKNGSWHSLSWKEWSTAAREIAGGLRSLGIESGDRVSILANTRFERVYCDIGVLCAGGTTVPIYPSSTPEQCEYILNNCGAKILVVEDPHQLEKLFDPDVAGKLDSISKVIWLSDTAQLERPDHKGRKTVNMAEVLPEDKADWVMSLKELRELGRKWLADNSDGLENIASDLDPDQAATIVYTSGTTGPPKGVVLTHKNITFEGNALRDLLGLEADDVQLLFLPLAHIFARLMEFMAITVGFKTAFAEGVPQLIQNMGEVQPTFMGAVPRVYEKAYAKIKANFAAKRKKAITRMLIDWAMKQGAERSRRLKANESADTFGIRLADKLVFSKVQATFGGRLRFFVSGGAPLAAEIANFFHRAGILVLEDYGLTEVTAASHVNRPDQYRFGTVGPALPGVEVQIAADGEILIRGDNVMQGYYNQPEATAEAINAEGWFHTGDIGVIEDGFLRITDRKKDIIVTAGGKNVAPQNIENAFKTLCPLASQMMVYGDKRKFLSAIVTLSEEALLPWAQTQGLSGGYAELTQTAEARAVVQVHIDQLNADLASYETIKKFAILDRDFDQETGELTPTLKVKRKFCSQKFEQTLEAFYEGAESTL